MKTFINLVDSNASSKKYKKLFNMTPSNVRGQTKLVPYYRLFIELADKVIELQRKRSRTTDLDTKKEIHNEIVRIRKNYAPRLGSLRNIK